jgi:hypothetical protein
MSEPELSEVFMRPAMWWRTINDHWYAFGIVWRGEGPHQPHVELRGRDWNALVEAAAELGMKLDLAADDVKGGHPTVEYPGEPEGSWIFKTSRPSEFHWLRQTNDCRAHVTATRWNELCEFLEEMGVEPPDRPAPSVRDGVIAA